MEPRTDLYFILVVSSYPMNIIFDMAVGNTSWTVTLDFHQYQYDLLSWKYEANDKKTRSFILW